MPNFGSHISGPLRHATKKPNRTRSWFGNLTVGMNDPFILHHLLDFQTVDQYNTTNYTYSSSGTGTSAAVNTSSNAVNGILLLSTGSTAGNYANAQSKVLGWQLDPTVSVANTTGIQDTKDTWFEASFTADVASTDIDAFIGLSETQVDVMGLSANYIGFRITNGGANIKFVSSTASSLSSGTASGGSGNSVALVQGTQTRVAFRFTGSNTVDYYINQTYMNSFSGNVFPTSPLALAYQIQTASANNRTLSLDYVYVAKRRF